jgi:hypothetical protein
MERRNRHSPLVIVLTMNRLVGDEREREREMSQQTSSGGRDTLYRSTEVKKELPLLPSDLICSRCWNESCGRDFA